MSWHDRLYLATTVAMAVLPFLLMVYFLVRRRRELRVAGWRYWLALTGLFFGLIAAVPSPLFYFALELPVPVKASWLPIIAGSLPSGLISGLVAIPLLAFGRGRVRWLGMLSTLLCVALLYFTLLGLSD